MIDDMRAMAVRLRTRADGYRLAGASGLHRQAMVAAMRLEDAAMAMDGLAALESAARRIAEIES